MASVRRGISCAVPEGWVRHEFSVAGSSYVARIAVGERAVLLLDDLPYKKVFA